MACVDLAAARSNPFFCAEPDKLPLLEEYLKQLRRDGDSIAARMWAGMSSSPWQVCANNGSPSGTNRAKKRSRSERTSGSAFSWMSNEAEVCWRWSVSKPVRSPVSANKA